MSVKSFLLKIYYFGKLSGSREDANQKIIRDAEWDAIKKHIPSDSIFLDVGCGAGYALRKAGEMGCSVFGIDPDPGSHGVGRYDEDYIKDANIVQAFAESIPFPDHNFDVVYSSHVLEHVTDELKSMSEMHRVLKPNGVLIIGMPTASMAWINFITQVLFTTHQRIFNFIFSRLKVFNTSSISFKHIFFPPSHTDSKKNILYDLKHYKINNWKRIVSGEFKITETILPALYPYPNYLQLFKMKRNKRLSSSVFFICIKK